MMFFQEAHTVELLSLELKTNNSKSVDISGTTHTLTDSAYRSLQEADGWLQEEIMNIYFEMVADWGNNQICQGSLRYLALPTRATLLLFSGCDLASLTQGKTSNHLKNVSLALFDVN